MVVEQFGHDEMEQCPKFSHTVLDWSSGEQESITCLELQEHFPASRQVVFDCLSFVKYHIVPLNFQESGLVFRIVDNEVVRGYDDVDLESRVHHILRI